jgi:hypothetical protein
MPSSTVLFGIGPLGSLLTSITGAPPRKRTASSTTA